MTQKSQHTQGPWDYFVGNAKGKGLIRVEVQLGHERAGTHICSMPRGQQSEANARLIAAAPMLLAVAEQALAAFNYLSLKPPLPQDREEFKKRESACRAAIAAAKGE